MSHSSPVENEDVAPAQTTLRLQVLVLDLTDEIELREPVRRFLEAYVRSHHPDAETCELSDFLEDVWPDGLATTFYVSNIGTDPNGPTHHLKLLLRPACEGPLANAASVGPATLGVRAFRRQGKLAVEGLEVTPHVPLRAFEARVAGPVLYGTATRFMAQADFDALRALPFHRAETGRRLEEWRHYLDWKERLIQSKQVVLPYESWRWEGETWLTFLVRQTDLPEQLVGLDLGAAPHPGAPATSQSSRRRPQRGELEVTKLGEVDKVLQPTVSDRRAWADVQLSPQHRCVRIRIDEEVAEGVRDADLPRTGQLVSAIAGDLAPLGNQRSGIDRLQRSQGFSPRLADFIFASARATVPAVIPELVNVDRSRPLNTGQQEAVAKALAAPDLCLIQGPPGTGKTTVIADICLRATNEGKRVLVASQTNLAVDNALARLAGVPWVRPLRLGKKESVDEEFRDYLEENVIRRWFESIAEHCSHRLESARNEEQALSAREAAVAHLRTALEAHASAMAAQIEAERATKAAAAARTNKEEERDKARAQVNLMLRRLEHLASLALWARGESAPPPDAAEEPWPTEVMVPSAVDVPDQIVLALDAMRSRLDALIAVDKAIEAAIGEATADPVAATELRTLRDEKQRLVDSDSEADMDRLRVINKRIKGLERGGWNQLTGALDRAARRAYSEWVPPEIARTVDALEPSPAARADLLRARALVHTHTMLAQEADKAARNSEALWVARRGELVTALRVVEATETQVVHDLEQATTELVSCQEREDAAADALREALARWNDAWLATKTDQAPSPPSQASLDRVTRSVAAARKERSSQLLRASRWRDIQSEWLTRLSQASEADRSQVQQLYVRHCNIVGMTCNEAGKRATWQDPDFEPFDIVIVDEVSKATPPELILPLLLGAKAVLVGDHRQLPPMFRERDGSFQAATEDGDVEKDDLDRFQRMVTASLFQELFEQAPNSIKATLWTQYRMHPDVMDAVNQFYEGRLEAGPDRQKLALERAHHLEVRTEQGRFLEPGNHLVWVDSTRDAADKPVWEEQRGSSKVNLLEVEIVAASLVRIGEALAARGYGQTRVVSIRAGAGEDTWLDALQAAQPRVPVSTLRDLFGERRIRLNGRALRAEDRAQEAQIEVRSQKDVGVITLYGAQLKELRRRIQGERHKHPEVFATMDLRTNTVDRFQGMEKPIVLVSLVRSKQQGGLGRFVREYQRINVGLSRAQQLLIVVGAEETWSRVNVPLPPLSGGSDHDVRAYHEILELARRAGGRRLARQVLFR